MPPDLANLPRHVDRRIGAELVKRFYFPISPRTLERWPLAWRHVNGRAVTETAELLALAGRMFDAAAPIRSGQRLVEKPMPDLLRLRKHQVSGKRDATAEFATAPSDAGSRLCDRVVKDRDGSERQSRATKVPETGR